MEEVIQPLGDKVRVAVMIGRGGRLPAIWDGTQSPTSLAQLCLVVSFKKNSPGLEWARQTRIPARQLLWSEFRNSGRSREDYDLALANLLEEQQTQLVVIAGWGLMLSKVFLDRFPGRVINVHPALLTDELFSTVQTISGEVIPVFRGNNALELALASGVSTTGCTVHYVTEEMDTGPVILKREVSIRGADTLDTLADRVHAAEEEILPQAIEIVCEKILRQSGAFNL